MIGVDTNVLVRFLTQDDPAQARRANRVFSRMSPEEPGFISTIVLVEAFWVLTRAYKHPRDRVLMALDDLVNSEGITVQDAPQVARAITVALEGADLPDALIAVACRAAVCTEILSFDKRAKKVLGFSSP